MTNEELGSEIIKVGRAMQSQIDAANHRADEAFKLLERLEDKFDPWGDAAEFHSFAAGVLDCFAQLKANTEGKP